MADLQLTVWFDKPSYLGHEQITAHARVTNGGTATADQVLVTSAGNLNHQGWTPFYPLGIPIGPGQTVLGSTTGELTTTEDVLRLVVTAQMRSGQEDANPADNTVTATVPITFVRGSLRGTVYGDRDGSNTMDPGEALAGVTVHAFKVTHPRTKQTTVTDSSGRFVFPDVLVGPYVVNFESAEWFVDVNGGDVTGTADPDLLCRGVPRVGSALSASARFTQPTYQVNDLAHVTMTLINKSTHPLVSLTAYFWGTGWEQLNAGALTGAGLTLPAGTTQTVDVTVRVNDQAATYGYLRLFSRIGAPPESNGSVDTDATARVPGGVAAKVVGRLAVFWYKPQLGPPVGTPLPNVQVYLRSPLSGKICARAVTDAGGNFTFFNLPVDRYDFGIVGPWVIVWPGPVFDVRSDETGTDWMLHAIFVKPGPDQPDPEAQQQPTGQPAPGDDTPQPQDTSLAWTGANVSWLALGGLVALAAGAGLILPTRRRKSH